MDLFDIVGPIMVGPSSSHTAGAVRIGYIAGQLLGEPLKRLKYSCTALFLLPARDMALKRLLLQDFLA